VPLPDGPITACTLDLLGDEFAAAHRRMYGFLAEEEPVQLVTFRVEATGLVAKATLAQAPMSGTDASAAIRAQRDVWIAEEERSLPCPIYDRDLLKPGNRLPGPAIVEQMDATTLVLPGMAAHVDKYLNLILEAA
jgi:N-methylhydantoinase A